VIHNAVKVRLQALAEDAGDEFAFAVYAQFVEHCFDMIADSACGDVQPLGDVGVGQPVG
jgi:hypothetical protein